MELNVLLEQFSVIAMELNSIRREHGFKSTIVNIAVFSEKTDVPSPNTPPPPRHYHQHPTHSIMVSWVITCCHLENVVHTIKHNELIVLSLRYIYTNLVGFLTLVPVHTCSDTKQKMHIHVVSLKSANRFMRYADKRYFFFFLFIYFYFYVFCFFVCLKFSSLSAGMTLKIRSRSPKPIQLFIMSQCYSIYI